jgi:hypothetical protein
MCVEDRGYCPPHNIDCCSLQDDLIMSEPHGAMTRVGVGSRVAVASSEGGRVYPANVRSRQLAHRLCLVAATR